MPAILLDFEFEPEAEFGERFSQVPDLLENLTRIVQEKTSRMICDLRIDVSKSEIILCGRTRAYYYKQVATQAVLTELSAVAEMSGGAALARLPFRNEIQVLVAAR
jgi:hypothetical protein